MHQQYRVNYTLLIGLLVGTLLTSVAVYGLWRFQIERRSGVLLSEAEKAREAKNYKDAARFYSHYLSIHGGDPATKVKLANAFADRLEQDDVTPEEVGIAVRSLETTVRELPDELALQQRLAELYGKLRRHQDALDHLGYMLSKDPNNKEAQALQASYLIRSGNFKEAAEKSYKLIGYDSTTDTFDKTKAVVPDNIDAYASLAFILGSKLENPELADRVMEQMVEVNPESAQAYLARGRYRSSRDEQELGQDDFEEAYQLDPKNAAVLLAVADAAANNEQEEKAREYVEIGKKLHPDDPSFYQAGAGLFAKQQKYLEALAEIDAGLKAVPGQRGSMLLFYKADLQLHNNDMRGVRDTVLAMKQADFRPELVEWYDARILLAEEKWFPALQALSKLRSRVNDIGDLSIQLENFIGLCSERLGRLEMALEAYESVVKMDPTNEPAVKGVLRVRQMMGLEVAEAANDPLQQKLAEILRKPKEEQDWSTVQNIIEQMEAKKETDPVNLKLLKAQIALMREDFASARKYLGEADKLRPDNLPIYVALIGVARLDPKMGPEKAMQVWNTVSKKFGDVPELRLAKADVLIALKGEQLQPELASLATGIDGWDTNQKVMLWSGLAARYANLNMLDEAKRYFNLVAENRPNELPLRMQLFTLALETNDDAGMEEAQKKILEIVGDPSDSNYLYADARRKISQMRRGQLGPEAIEPVRRTIDRAINQRPDWHELHVLNGELELMAGNAVAALDQFDRAAQLGRPAPGAVAQHIRLLVAFGELNRAAQMLERIPEGGRQALLGQLYHEILFRTKQVDRAIEEAQAAAEAAPDDPQKQYWYGQLLARSAMLPDVSEADRKQTTEKAIAALRKAVEMEPEMPDAWYALITLSRQQEDMNAAQQALRDAQLALSGDNLQIFLAKSYEALGRWFDAETMYRAFYEADPTNVARAQQLAAFYLGPIYQQQDQLLKVQPLINQILKAGVEGDGKGNKLAADDPNLLWARRMGARILAGTQDYQNVVKAEKLLASSAQKGTLPIEDRLQMAEILSKRPEPESRRKAVALLNEVDKIQELNEQAQLTLGQLYFAMGDWTNCQRQMQKTISRFRNSAAARELYIRMLLSRADSRYYQEAERQLVLLRQIAPNSRSTFALSVQLGAKMGRQKEVRADILRMIPNVTDPKQLTDEQDQLLDFIGGLLVELDDLDTAEKIYRMLYARNPKRALALAQFLGLHRDVGASFEQFEQVYDPERPGEVLSVAVNILRARRDDVGDKYDAKLNAWLERALRDNPDSISLQLVEADYYDVQKRYEESAAVYSKLLARPDLEGFRRAVVLNNLSYLLALAGNQAGTSGGDQSKDPLKLVDEAASILGPSSDILDTRAVVLIGQKKYQEAIDELQLSVEDNPTASKYFHLVLAHLGANENRAALQAWEKAEALGLTRDSLNRLEHDKYEAVKIKIEQLRSGGSSVTQSETRRQAG